MKRLFKLGIDKKFSLNLLLKSVFVSAIVVISVSVAVLVSSLVFDGFFVLDKKIEETKTVKRADKKKINIDGILKLFDMEPETEPEEKKTSVTEEEKNVENIRNYTILGTIFTDKGRFLVVSSDGKWKLLKKGDMLNGKRIVKVSKLFYEIEDNGIVKKIPLFSKKELNGENTNRTEKNDMSSPADTGSKVVKLDKTTVLKETEDIGKLLSQVVIVPVIRKGETVGYRFKRIARNSILRKIGFKNGDIISSVNDIPVRTAEDAFKIYNMMRNEDTLKIELERRGRKEVVIYEIR